MSSSNQQDLAISSILDEKVHNEETDILEYCTPNYATNTSKLFSTKGNKNIVHTVESAESDRDEQVQVYGYGMVKAREFYFRST